MLKKILLVLLSVVVASGMACSMGQLKLTVQFNAIEGLKVDDPVVFEQNRIGSVRKIRYTAQGNYLVGIVVEPEFKNALTVDSVIYIDSDPVTSSGKAVIVELPTAGGAPLVDNALVVGSEKPRYWQQMFDTLREEAGELEEGLRRKLDELKEGYGDKSAEIDRELEAAIADIARQLKALEQAIRKAPDSEEAKELQRLMEQLVAELERVQAEVQEQVYTELLPRLSQAVAELQRHLEELGRRQEVDRPADSRDDTKSNRRP